MWRILNGIGGVVFFVLAGLICTKLRQEFGMNIALCAINFLVLIFLWLADYERWLGSSELDKHCKERIDTNTNVTLPPDATFNAGILTSTFGSFLNAPEVKSMQEIWFALQDTRTSVAGFKSQLVGLLFVNFAAFSLYIVASFAGGKASVGAQSIADNFDAQTVVIVAVTLIQITWLVRLPHVYYQRNMTHLAKIKRS